LELDRNGRLMVNEETFKTALAEKPGEVESLFGLTGIGTAFVQSTDAATTFGTGVISAQLTTITESTISLRRREGDAQKKLGLRREQLIQQYTRMEQAMVRLNQQSGSLLASTKGLQANDR
jgi:flagellar hook-associated protein 2